MVATSAVVALIVALVYWREGFVFCCGVFGCSFVATMVGLTIHGL